MTAPLHPEVKPIVWSDLMLRCFAMLDRLDIPLSDDQQSALTGFLAAWFKIHGGQPAVPSEDYALGFNACMDMMVESYVKKRAKRYEHAQADLRGTLRVLHTGAR